MQPDDTPLSSIERAQIQVALEWEKRMHRLFKGIYPRNERRKAMARKSR